MRAQRLQRCIASVHVHGGTRLTHRAPPSALLLTMTTAGADGFGLRSVEEFLLFAAQATHPCSCRCRGPRSALRLVSPPVRALARRRAVMTRHALRLKRPAASVGAAEVAADRQAARFRALLPTEDRWKSRLGTGASLLRSHGGTMDDAATRRGGCCNTALSRRLHPPSRPHPARPTQGPSRLSAHSRSAGAAQHALGVLYTRL